MSSNEYPSEGSEPESPETSQSCQSPKKKKKLNYVHKYKTSWEKQLQAPNRKNKNNFFCKRCNIDLIGGIVAAKRHEATSNHVKKCNASKMQKSVLSLNIVSNTSQVNKTKEIELRYAAFLVEHNISINTSSHLEGLIKEVVKYPEAAKNITLKKNKDH
jgi:hypothetical protein